MKLTCGIRVHGTAFRTRRGDKVRRRAYNPIVNSSLGAELFII